MKNNTDKTPIKKQNLSKKSQNDLIILKSFGNNLSFALKSVYKKKHAILYSVQCKPDEKNATAVATYNGDLQAVA